MKRVVMFGQNGIFFTKEEYETLCEKILANNVLIRELKEEVGLK